MDQGSSPINQIRDLVFKHNLSYTFNPGGAEFYCHQKPSWRCQVSAMDDADDLAILQEALKNFDENQ